MAIEYNFTLDMDRSKRDNNIAYARTGDVDSITINADLVLNGAAYTPSGTNAFFECITPNGHSIRAAAEKTGSSVSVEVPSAAFQAAGVINVAYFRFETGEADNPTYVESTEPFAIVVREGIGDNIDAGDYIEEWRQLADQLEAIVAEVEQKAEQAETAINEQKTEVDQLKAQAQVSIAGDVTEVEEAAQSAITAINKEKADVADAAEDVSAAGEQAINTFKTNSQQAINQFNTNGTSAISQFNTKADGKLEEVDGMITEAQGDVDAAITQLENKTQDAIDAAQDALDGTTATNLQNAINRTLKLDVADMTVIPDNASLSSFTNVGSYCCKTAATAATVGDCPVDDSPFNMYVFSSSTSGQVMQLVVPIDLNGKPTAEWHVRFGTSSAMDPWSVIGGGADISAGLGIDVTGDAKKTVALDTTAFYQHHEAASIIQGSTEVTGGGRFKELVVYGNTRQNLWVNPNEAVSGVTVTSNNDGSVTVDGTTTSVISPHVRTYALRPGSTYTISVDKVLQSSTEESNGCFFLEMHSQDGSVIPGETIYVGYGNTLSVTLTIPEELSYAHMGVFAASGKTLSGTYRVMLNEGDTAEPWCPPGLNGVEELSIVTAGKNLYSGKQPAKTNSYLLIDVYDSLEQLFVGEKVSISFDVTVPKSGDWRLYAYQGSGLSIDFSSNPSGNGSAEPKIFSLVANQETHIAATGEVFYNPVDGFNTGQVMLYLAAGVSGTVRADNIQIELGFTATAYEPPAVTTTPIDLDGHTLNSLPDGTRDELRVDGTGAVTLVQRVGVATAPTAAASWSFASSLTRAYFGVTDRAIEAVTEENGWCNKLPMLSTEADITDPIYATVGGSNAYAKHPSITSADTAATVAGGATYLYKLAEPQEIELPDVSLPSLVSSSYTVFVNSKVQAEIEAEVVKVDYLPPSDVYTKEEVDKKIENAGGMPDVVPVSQGGTGVTTAAAERNRLGLGNTTGALPVANGGTGAANAKAAQNALLGDMNSRNSDNPDDDSYFVMAYDSPSNSSGAVYKRNGANIWNWISSKIRSAFGFSSSNVLTVANGGTGAANAKAAQYNLLANMNDATGVITDETTMVFAYASPTTGNGAVYKNRMAKIWDYIASKVADKVWDQIKTKAISSDTTTGTDLTLTGGLESSSQIRKSTLTLGINEMSLDNSNAAPLTVNGEEVVTEGNISSHLPAMFDAKSVWFSTPLKQGQQKNIITEGGFTLEELRKYFVPGNLVLANMVCGGDHDVQYEVVVPMVITLGDGMVMQPTGITYNSIADAHFDCIFAVANNEQAGGGVDSGLADGVTMLYSVTEVPGYANRTSTSSLKGFTVFDVVSHAI